MWRRGSSCGSHLKTLTLAPWRSQSSLLPRTLTIQSLSSIRLFSSDPDKGSLKKKVEDVMPIATGHEREEIEAELEGRKRFDMDAT